MATGTDTPLASPAAPASGPIHDRYVRGHRLRDELVLEVHARPFEALVAPARGSHIAIPSNPLEASTAREHMAALCLRYGAPVPSPGANYYSQDLGPFRVRWEQHTEFTTYTFVRSGPFKEPFADPVIGLVPRDWLDGLNGDALAAIHFALEPASTPERDPEALSLLFNGNGLIGSEVTGGHACAWSDLRTHEDGFSRILVRDVQLSKMQAGRLVQRLLEINTYRLMALLSLPLAREVSPVIHQLDAQLGAITAQLAHSPAGGEKALLDQISGIAAELERIGAMTSYRFSGTRAYFDIVMARLQQIRQNRIEGLQTLSEFLERRLTPAVNFCVATADRANDLAERMARVGSLVRARVEVQIEEQNRDVLASMDRRSNMQFRLQRVVESLSVAAAMYYLLGLTNYALHALEAAGVHINPELGAGIALPFIALLVWWILHLARRALDKEHP